MKSIHKFFLRSFSVLILPLGFTGCFTEGYIGVNNGVYYGPHRDPWFHDDLWMDGHRWYGGPQIETSVGIYLHPPRHQR